MALITIWLLSCFEESQIPCTAPTETQLKDVLWAEIGVWLNKMPEAMQSQFVKTGSYIRVEG